MAKITATHRLRRPHQVLYDSKLHFNVDNPPAPGKRIRLPIGTHMIPSETQLKAFPDRFESLSTPEPPATIEDGGEDKEEEEEDEGEPDTPEVEDEEPETAFDDRGVEPDDEGKAADEAEDASEASEDEGEEDAAHVAVGEALAAVSGEWDALTSAQLQDLAAGYNIGEDDVVGTGSGGNVLKADWIRAVQEARGGEGA